MDEVRILFMASLIIPLEVSRQDATQLLMIIHEGDDIGDVTC